MTAIESSTHAHEEPVDLRGWPCTRCQRTMALPDRCLSCDGAECAKGDAEHAERMTYWESLAAGPNPFQALWEMARDVEAAVRTIATAHIPAATAHIPAATAHIPAEVPFGDINEEEGFSPVLCRCERLVIGPLWEEAYSRAWRAAAEARIPFADVAGTLRAAQANFGTALNALSSGPDEERTVARALKLTNELLEELFEYTEGMRIEAAEEPAEEPPPAIAAADQAAAPAVEPVPRWIIRITAGVVERMLTFRGKTINYKKKDPPQQRAILDSFQAANWTNGVKVARTSKQISSAITELNNKCSEEGLALRFYRQDGLVFWSDTAADAPRLVLQA